MALIECPNCARQISTTAIRCPGCGAAGPSTGTAGTGRAPSSNALTASIADKPILSAASAGSVSRPRLQTAARVLALVLLVILITRWIHGCGSSIERYYPLKEGRTWKYRASLTLRSLPISGEGVLANLAPRTLQGMTVVPQTIDMSFGSILGITLPKTMAVTFFENDQYGVREVAHQESTDVEPKFESSYTLKYPIEVGTHWTDKVKTLLLKRGLPISVDSSIVSTTDQVITPAGSFSNCIRVTSIGKTDVGPSGAFVSAEANSWYAPDVGQVKSIYSESDGDPSDKQTFLLELEEYKR